MTSAAVSQAIAMLAVSPPCGATRLAAQLSPVTQKEMARVLQGLRSTFKIQGGKDLGGARRAIRRLGGEIARSAHEP